MRIAARSSAGSPGGASIHSAGSSSKAECRQWRRLAREIRTFGIDGLEDLQIACEMPDEFGGDDHAHGGLPVRDASPHARRARGCRSVSGADHAARSSPAVIEEFAAHDRGIQSVELDVVAHRDGEVEGLLADHGIGIADGLEGHVLGGIDPEAVLRIDTGRLAAIGVRVAGPIRCCCSTSDGGAYHCP